MLYSVITVDSEAVSLFAWIGTGLAFAQNNFPVFVIPIGIFVLVIAFVILMLYLNARWEKQRTEALREIATSLGFDFFPEGSPASITELGEFHLFQLGRGKKIKNLMQGQAQELTISLFDYTYVLGSGKNQQTIVQSVFVARRAGMDLPMFSVRPKSFWHRLGHLFGMKDIEFDTHPAFTKACLLKGTNEPAIRAIFSEAALDYLAAHPAEQVEGNGERLMYYRGLRVKPEKLRDFMAEGFEILKLFPPN